MGYLKKVMINSIWVFIAFYLIWGLFNEAQSYYPEIILWFIPENLHQTRLWDSVFLENPNLIIGCVTIGTIITAWGVKRAFF